MAKKGKKAKSAKRVAAGKRAWAKLSAPVKAARIRALTGKASRAGGRTKMAKKGGGGGRRKQGIVSWITSIFALLIGLFPAWEQLAFLFKGAPLENVTHNLNALYNPLAGNVDQLKRGYGALVGGIVFKVVTGELTKRAKITSIIPALHA